MIHWTEKRKHFYAQKIQPDMLSKQGMVLSTSSKSEPVSYDEDFVLSKLQKELIDPLIGTMTIEDICNLVKRAYQDTNTFFLDTNPDCSLSKLQGGQNNAN